MKKKKIASKDLKKLDKSNNRSNMELVDSNRESAIASREEIASRWPRNFRKATFFKKLSVIELPDGKCADFWKKVIDKLHRSIFDVSSPLTEKEKIELAVRLMDQFVSKEPQESEGRPENYGMGKKSIREQLLESLQSAIEEKKKC